MPLNLDKYKLPEDYIEYEKEKYFITADLPQSFFHTYKKFTETKEPGKQIKLIDEFIESILTQKNAVDKVKKLIKKISLSEKMQIANFYNAFVAETYNSKAVKKKKRKLKGK